MSFYAQYPASASGNNASVGTDGAPIPGASTIVGGEDPTGNLKPLSVNADGELIVNVDNFPSGGATAANQVLEISAIEAFSDKTQAGLVPEAYDYQAITYVGATTNINTVVYKLGGSGGTTVATLTMGYDGSSRLTSVTRS